MKRWFWINKCTKNSSVINIRHQSLRNNHFFILKHNKRQACKVYNELTLRIAR